MVFMRRWRDSARAAVAAAILIGSAAAQPGPPNAAESKPGDPVVANVEGHLIYFSDLGGLAATLPENLRGLPFETLFPVLLDHAIDDAALAALARRRHLDEDAAVQREVAAAADRALAAALLRRETATITEDAIRARYAQQYANRGAAEETRARHILVPTEAEAAKLIEQLGKGADFADLARQFSKDPDGTDGGDLGFFRRGQVGPEFADIAFALAPGQVAPAPVHNEFGWHVVKVEERRLVAPPDYAAAHDALRQVLAQEAVQRVIDEARGQMSVRKFNIDGSPAAPFADARPARPAKP